MRMIPKEERWDVHLLISGLHLWTCLWGTELSDGAIEKIDLVVEVDNWTGPWVSLHFLNCALFQYPYHLRPATHSDLRLQVT